ncbi:uncharacterized protein LOC131155975 [Malania oleifera]|uniref:uncharacterized protein LOC131155975 n=1 Tax=Malania oleifera TaxID=397392 RepID=UPI0025AE25FF|nr:uncharacterized protein LOC131155975 [Malania oleifera]
MPVAMMWGCFREVFFDRYFLASVRKAKTEEFLNSTQGQLIVQQYVTRFVELSHFAPYMVQEFATLVDKVTVVEASLQGDVEAQNSKKRPMLSSSHIGARKGPWRSYQANIRIVPYEALYGRRCRSSLYWDKVGERKILGPELVQQTYEKVQFIRERIKTTQSRPKSYANICRRELEFEIGDTTFLRISLMKGVMRFEKKRKLSPRYIRLFEILERVGLVAYKIALPPSLSRIHDVFHISILRKYILNPSHVINYESFELEDTLVYEEIPIQILDYKEHELHTKMIPLIKVLWHNHAVEEASWESETEIRQKYPQLFREAQH